MGTIQRLLATIASFFGIVWNIISLFVAPLKGLGGLLSSLSFTISGVLSVMPSWLLGLATFSVTVGVALLILGRK